MSEASDNRRCPIQEIPDAPSDRMCLRSEGIRLCITRIEQREILPEKRKEVNDAEYHAISEAV